MGMYEKCMKVLWKKLYKENMPKCENSKATYGNGTRGERDRYINDRTNSSLSTLLAKEEYLFVNISRYHAQSIPLLSDFSFLPL
jgi:hypothetical protein